jgi:hypothetical protein
MGSYLSVDKTAGMMSNANAPPWDYQPLISDLGRPKYNTKRGLPSTAIPETWQEQHDTGMPALKPTATI